MSETVGLACNKRVIRSYGRKKSRCLSGAQKRCLVDFYEKYGVKLPDDIIDPCVLFGNRFNDVVIEIGFGTGEHLVQTAKIDPNIGFIGCDPFENGVAAALREIDENRLANLLIYNNDARFLISLLQDNSVKRFYVLFPDPWMKNRHHKRRLLSLEFITLLSRKVKIGGDIVIATDCENYMISILENAKKISDLALETDYANNSSEEVSCMQKQNRRLSDFSTKYKRKAQLKGHVSYHLLCTRL